MLKRKHVVKCVLLAGALAAAGWAGIALTGSAQAEPAVKLADGDKVDFATQIVPILKDKCVKCHTLDNPRKKAAAGLQLDNKAAAFKGGKSGKAIVPGNAKQSLLYESLLGPVKAGKIDVPAMPKAKKGEKFTALPQEQIDLIGKWIDQGANWPD